MSALGVLGARQDRNDDSWPSDWSLVNVPDAAGKAAFGLVA